jgi:hypothetical protein
MNLLPFDEYYINQAGTGIAGFAGVRYQKGHGFFGRLLSQAILPILKYLGKKAVNTGVNIGTDILQGENFKDSIKKRMKSTGFDIAEEALEKVKKQRGSGRKRKIVVKKRNKRKGLKRKPSLLQLQALARGRLSLKKKNRGKRRKSSVKKGKFTL